MNSDFKLEPTPAEKAAADKAAAAADTKLGNPNLTPAERDAKPSNELKIVGSMEDLNNRDKLSNTSELNLGGKQPSDLLKEKPNANIKTGAKPAEQTKTSDPIIFQTAIGDKIPDALTNMMLMSKAVSDDMTNIDNSDPSNPRTYTPRISSSISVDPNTKERTVTFYIEKFAKPMKPDTSTGTSTEGSSTPGTGTATGQPAQSQSQAEDFSKLPEILEFDYIYTGTNVDVIQFDMNLKLAFSSLKSIQVVHPTATNNNQDLTADNAAATDKKANENAGEARDVPTTRVKSNGADDTTKNDHVGPTVSDPMRIGSGSLSPETLFAGRKNLSDQISTMLSTTTSVMKIVGNPLLLAGYVLPYDTYDDATPQSIKANKDAHRDKTGADSSGMLKVRVNIRTPKPSYMQGQPAVPDDNYYSSPFWMDKNYFYLKKITNKFTKGEFVQLLELNSLAENSNTKGGDIPAKNPRTPTTVSKPAGESINETQGANVKAFLDMISHAEGTYGKGDNGYNVRYGGTLFEGYSTHPWKVKPWSTGGIKHTPAGRYQITEATFDGLKSKSGGDFSPSSQDRMAVALMKNKGAYDLVVQGKPAEAIKKLPATWSSFNRYSEATLLKWYEQHGGTYKPQTSDALPSTEVRTKDYGPSVTTNGTGVKPGKQKDFMDKNWNAANIAADKLGTDPKILLAQSAEETGWGKRTTKDKNTGQDSNNMFNIKADKNWHGPTVTANVPEYDANGNKYYVDQKFRAYSTPEESFADYVDFLNSNKRYNTITKNPTKDPMEYFGRLKQAHYATAPNYATALTGMYNGSSIKNYKPK